MVKEPFIVPCAVGEAVACVQFNMLLSGKPDVLHTVYLTYTLASRKTEANEVDCKWTHSEWSETCQTDYPADFPVMYPPVPPKYKSMPVQVLYHTNVHVQRIRRGRVGAHAFFNGHLFAAIVLQNALYHLSLNEALDATINVGNAESDFTIPINATLVILDRSTCRRYAEMKACNTQPPTSAAALSVPHTRMSVQQKQEACPIIRGGRVITPLVGLHQGAIAAFDFNSLYPSIVKTMLLDHIVFEERFPFEKQLKFKERLSKCVTEDEENDAYCEVANMLRMEFDQLRADAKVGSLPWMLQRLIQARESPCLRSWPLMRDMLKKVANSMIGVLGASYSGLPHYNAYQPMLLNIITAIGRRCLGQLVDVAGSLGQVVYGDTDSVFVSYDPTMYSAQGLSERILARMKTLSTSHVYEAVTSLKFKVEGKFDRLIIYGKKRYIGRSATNPFDIVIKGVECNRSDYPYFASHLIKSVCIHLLNQELLSWPLTQNAYAGMGVACNFVRKALDRCDHADKMNYMCPNGKSVLTEAQAKILESCHHPKSDRDKSSDVITQLKRVYLLRPLCSLLGASDQASVSLVRVALGCIPPPGDDSACLFAQGLLKREAKFPSVRSVVSALTKPIGIYCKGCNKTTDIDKAVRYSESLDPVNSDVFQCCLRGSQAGMKQYVYGVTVYEAWRLLNNWRNEGSMEAAHALGGPLLGYVDLSALFAPMDDRVQDASADVIMMEDEKIDQ